MPNSSPNSQDLPSSLKWGPFGIVLVWLAVMGVLYLLMTQYLQPKPVTVLPGGVLVIPKARDGHFYAEGTVGGKPARFLVDTGASLVTVVQSLRSRRGWMAARQRSSERPMATCKAGCLVGCQCPLAPRRSRACGLAWGWWAGSPVRRCWASAF
jgi:hypothetical protein